MANEVRTVESNGASMGMGMVVGVIVVVLVILGVILLLGRNGTTGSQSQESGSSVPSEIDVNLNAPASAPQDGGQ